MFLQFEQVIYPPKVIGEKLEYLKQKNSYDMQY